MIKKGSSIKKFVIAFLLFLPAALIAAEPDKTICTPLLQELEKLKHQEISVSPAQFEFDNTVYEGCQIIFKTKWSMLKGESDPMNVTNPIEGSPLYESGWRIDGKFSADGPGSTFYIIRNGEKLCIVEWSYEAYIDEETEEFVSGDDLLCKIRCGTKK